MLEAVLESMSSIAAINDFAPYYGTFMPGLMKVISMENWKYLNILV